MLTIGQCRKFLNENLPDEMIHQIRDSLYQAADILIENYFSSSGVLIGT
jgi:hypothetical protein